MGKFIFLFFISSLVYGSDITVINKDAVSLGIHEIDTIIDLPKPLRMIPKTKFYKILPIFDRVDEEGNPVNITALRIIRPRNSRRNEKIPLLLAGKMDLTLNLTFGFERHYRLRLPGSSKTRFDASNPWKTELELMKQMLRDVEMPEFKRISINSSLKIDGYDDLDLKLVRKWEGLNLSGYVFTLVNTSDQTVEINPAALNFGMPNKAIALQMDHAKLQPCHENNSPNPRDTGCMTAIRLVVRSKNWQRPGSKTALPWSLTRSN